MTLAPGQMLAVAYAVANLTCFCLFAWDKIRSSRPGAIRLRERTLHLWTLVSGGAGALAAMNLLRHKTRHASFWLVAVGALAAHVAGWATWVGR